MLPSPLHPAVVHFPIVFAVLLPVSALFALWAIRRGAAPRRAWALPLVLAMALTASGWVALETGEAEEDRVEAFVGEAALHEHEEAAERFLLFSGVVTLIGAAGMLAGTVGTAARAVATLGTLVVLTAGVEVGRAGGELVYEHGAARAYLSAPSLSPQPGLEGDWEEEQHRWAPTTAPPDQISVPNPSRARRSR